MVSVAFFLRSCLILGCISLLFGAASSNLVKGFYANSCPDAENLVYQEMKRIFQKNPCIAGSLLRLHFHDCFVQGCDGSIMLNSIGGTGEKDAYPSLTLKGFDEIEEIKRRLEESCSLTVSCADIIAMAARDSVRLTNGPYYEVETGRRDGNRSNQDDALNDLPPPSTTIQDLRIYFSQKGLSTKDIVVLTGAHTIGKAHCSSFSDRLYNFTGHGDLDPSVKPYYAVHLMKKCKSLDDNTTTVDMDPGSPLLFDLEFYRDVVNGQGLFTSDATLLDNSATRAYVLKQANATSPAEFFRDFAESMINMGRVGVITGTFGSIRSTCGVWVD